MRRNKLKSGEIRIINIDKTAIMEWLCESIVDNCEEFFDISDLTSVLSQSEWNEESGEFTFIIESSENGDSVGFHDFDFEKIRTKIGITTTTMFAPKRYKILNYLTDSSLLR